MRPESTSAILRPDLTAVAQEYDAEKAATKFIGRRAAPIFNSPIYSTTYPVVKRENFVKRTEDGRAPDGSYNRITGEWGTGTFTCQDHGIEYPIDDERRRRYSRYIDAESAATRMLHFQALLNHEYRVAALYSGAGLTNHNVTTAWTTTATAVPLADLRAGIDALSDACGAAPGDISLIIPRTDFHEMLACTTVNAKILYTYPGMQPAELTAQQVAAMLGIKEVLVARGAIDSTEEGVAVSMGQLWTAAVMYLAVLAGENDPLDAPSATRTIQWTEDSPEFPVIESYRDEKVRGDVLRERVNTDEVLTAEADLMAYKITNT